MLGTAFITTFIFQKAIHSLQLIASNKGSQLLVKYFKHNLATNVKLVVVCFICQDALVYMYFYPFPLIFIIFTFTGIELIGCF